MPRIDWNEIYSKDEVVGKKFDHLIKPIPWTDDVDQNTSDTLEWLLRSGRSKEVRYSEEPVINKIVDAWYRYEAVEGQFYHVCYPKELLMYRMRYDGLYDHVTASKDLMGAIDRNKRAKTALWSAWRCFGQDGGRIPQETPEDISTKNDMVITWREAEDQFSNWRQHWNNKCSRCSESLPRSLQMAVILQIKLAAALND